MIADIAYDLQPRSAAPLLERAVAILKCPFCHGAHLVIYRDESVELELLTHCVVVCDTCKTCFKYENGVLFFLTERPDNLTRAQRSNFNGWVQRFYQSAWRNWCMSIFCGRGFSNETEGEKLVSLIDWDSLPENPVFLDLATSHGFYALTIARHLRETNRNGFVMAVDFSPRMLKYAARHARRLGLQERVLWIAADVEHCPFRSGSVHGITCGGTLNEYGHPDIVFDQVKRMMNDKSQYVAMHLHRGRGIVGLFQDLVHHFSGLQFPTLLEWNARFQNAGLKIHSQESMGIVVFTTVRS